MRAELILSFLTIAANGFAQQYAVVLSGGRVVDSESALGSMRNVGIVAASASSSQAPDPNGSVCGTCHPKQASAQPLSPMAHAMESVSKCTILNAHPSLTFQSGKYSYRIERRGEESIYSVTDGIQTITVPIGWAFGLGQAGQTYVFEKDGVLYESRVSFYRAIDRLDLTLGAINQAPLDLLQAAGREMGKEDSAHCFRCHSTNSGTGSNLNLAALTPGIQCDRCHGPSADHVAGFKTGRIAAMKKLTDGTAEETNAFCGGCHRTWDEIAEGPKLGVASVRFQPYRITNSRCYETDDARIACVRCHDPHQPLNREDASYDAKCQACHSPRGKATATLCKVAKSNCVSCHMPKIEIPGSHYSFTDHQIRIVRPHERYPG